MGSCHRYGMVATDNISKGETMFEIPRSLLLSPTNCSIAHLLEHVEEEGLSNKNGRYVFLLHVRLLRQQPAVQPLHLLEFVAIS